MDIIVILKGIIFIVLALVFIEVLLELLINKLRTRFQWLITKKEDDLPELDSNGLNKFLADGFDGELGWVRKPNTEHPEIGKFGKTFWHINNYGARLNPGYEHMPVSISCYGDSFTFCRQVDDNETWEHYLSQLTETNVHNWAVGNYGIDQALLRLQREYPKHPTKIIIVGVVPDTISRILSTWKHFYEYGNTFGFKPRFVIRDGELCLLNNLINTKEKFYQIPLYLEELKQTDFFYKNKFTKEIISFPYIYSVFKNPSRNIPLIYWNTMALLSGDPKYVALANQKIMEINLSWRVKLYSDVDVKNLLVGIISKFSDFAASNNCKMIVVFLPQKDDISFIKSNGHFYQSVIDELSKRILVVDLAADFLNVDSLNKYYSDDSNYGGHYSAVGNEFVARILFNTLKKNLYIN